MLDASSAAEDKAERTFGQIALRERLITEPQLKECLEIQLRLRTAGFDSKPLGQVFIEKGYLSLDQVDHVRRLQTAEPANAKPATSTNLLRIPGYEILGKIGAGAMGTVFKARQISMDRLVAIKVLAPKYGKDRGYVERFLREARAVARLNHENIIGGIDVGEAGGFHYFVMELIDGEPVNRILRREGRLAEARCVQIGLQIARALDHAERHELVHRDVKPENIMITKTGIAKLCDLGLAKQTEEGDANLTQEGLSVGTPNYISPEQARGEAVDIRADLYSLGASLYHLATGTPPFDGPNPMAIMTKHVTDPVDPPLQRCPAISESFNLLLLKMMAKRREDRHQHASLLVTDFETLSKGGKPVARPPSRHNTRRVERKTDTALRLRASQRRSSLAPYVAAVSILVLLGVGGFFLFRPKKEALPTPTLVDRRDPPPKDPAESPRAKEHRERVEAYREFCRAQMSTMEKGWIKRILQRGEEDTREFAKTIHEGEWIRLVAEMRAKINETVKDRVWRELKSEVQKARTEGRFADALRRARELDPEYESTEAGKDQKNLIRELLDIDIPRAYLADKNRIAEARSEGRFDEAYRAVRDVLDRYGPDKAEEMTRLREEILKEDLAKILSEPPTPAKVGRALERLKGLQGTFAADADFVALLRRRSEEIRTGAEEARRQAAARAPEAYKTEILPAFEKALARRDLLEGRHALREFRSGETYAWMRPSVFGEGELPLLDALLDPKRIGPPDSRTVGAVESAAREAQAAGRRLAYEFLMEARALALLEELIEQALSGAELLAKDPGKFSKCSAALRNIVEAKALSRTAGDPWRLSVRRNASPSPEELLVAPRNSSGIADADVVILARRGSADVYAPLRCALLFFYSGALADAAGWLEQVKDPAPRFGIERYLDRVKNIASPAKEAEAKQKFNNAVSAYTKKKYSEALKILRDLRDNYANTEYLTTLFDEDGSKMAEPRIQTVRERIQELEKKEKDPKKKASVQDLFKGDAKQAGGRLEVVYDFAAEDQLADFSITAAGAQLTAVKAERGVRLKGTGFWYGKAQFRGNVEVEVTVRSHADQGIGLALHGKGSDQGYLGLPELGGGGPRFQGALILKLPIGGGNWQQALLKSGSKVDLKRDQEYLFRMLRQGADIEFFVNRAKVVDAKNAEFTSGLVGIGLVNSEATIERIRVTGEVDRTWLDEELRKLEK